MSEDKILLYCLQLHTAMSGQAQAYAAYATHTKLSLAIAILLIQEDVVNLDTSKYIILHWLGQAEGLGKAGKVWGFEGERDPYQ